MLDVPLRFPARDGQRRSGPKAANAATVELQEVTKAYGSVLAVDAVSLRVPPGQFVSLLGPSGCGKTSSLRLVAGFEHPDRGRILIAGRDVTQVPAHRRDFGMVFQSYALFPHLTVAENVEFGLKMRGLPRRERGPLVDQALSLVKLGPMAARYPKQLSGGQQQRVALARAIVFTPAVLLLDEPLGALDKALREEMQVELRQLQRELGITTLFVTHDQEEALTISDLVAVINNGRIEQLGRPNDLYERPRTEFVARFLGASNIIPATVRDRGNGLIHLDVLGRVVSCAVSLPSDLTRINVSLRPERIKLVRATDDAPFRVRDVLYRGPHRQITLVGGGDPPLSIVVIAANDSAREDALAPGDAALCSFDEESVVPLLPPDAAAAPGTDP